MIDQVEAVTKIKDLLKKESPQLNNDKLENLAQNLYELGLFLVRLKIKQHSIPIKIEVSEEFEQITDEPP